MLLISKRKKKKTPEKKVDPAILKFMVAQQTKNYCSWLNINYYAT